jgi:hypothetical protein
MTQLQHALEGTDKPEILQATGNVILELNKSYPATFSKFFRVNKLAQLIGYPTLYTKLTKSLYHDFIICCIGKNLGL